MSKKKKKKGDSHVDESWLLPYSDMLTLLLALFIVLFAMSEVDTQKYQKLAQVFNSEFGDGEGIFEEEEAPVELDNEANEDQVSEEQETNEMLSMKEIQQQINEYIEENNLGDVLGTQLSDEGLLVSIMNDVSFDPGSATVSGEGREIASEISNFLDTDPPRQIVISGHTDDIPMNNRQFGSNWELSVMRAVNFMSLILDNDHLDPTKFSAKGFGQHKPLVPNTSDENRLKNRRVEVLILPNYKIKEALEKEETSEN
ncbi:chemotaxis protein MotB [Oceanobacillus limi]|uniref:Chemotaxis protein MotB n=1 Tax=Oceanobacillus limi TaxID=930131 RepID=A0A1I0BLZ0_9BACI|nr:flagellar motor protein MotB [Oceanobacillus limi]SET07870.1 chemotaxis protein MotB [Oceanobacillus limi]